MSGTRHDPSWRRVPGSRRLVVHPRSGRSAGGVRTLSGTADWRRRLVDLAGVTALRVVGARRLAPVTSTTWPELPLDELAEVLAAELPGLRLLGAAVPRQAGRARLSLLGRMTGNLVVVKLGVDEQIDREATVLSMLSADPLPGIATPDVVDAGTLDIAGSAADYLVTGAIAVHGQQAAIDEPLRTFESDLADRLAELPRPSSPSTAARLVPVHGDLTPWNLRRTDRGLALFDWESAGWGLAGSDLATYRSACDVVRPWWRRGPRHEATVAPEAA